MRPFCFGTFYDLRVRTMRLCEIWPRQSTSPLEHNGWNSLGSQYNHPEDQVNYVFA
jgi:hypothetical protein